jgi:hypothetical protein
MKGQYLTVEYVIFFAMGIALITAVYFIFYNMSSSLREPSVNIQLQEIGELIRSSIVNVFEASESTNSTIFYNLSIPETLSGCVYAVEIKDKMFLNCTDDSRLGSSFALYGINIKSQNIIYSSKGFVEISVRNGVVELK